MIIGLTGQTGAGKSTVCEFLRQMSFCVIDCDKVAREVTEKGSPLLSKLADAFGSDIILEDGSLNRRLLASRAFSSEQKTELLNKITHPEILSAIKQKIEGSPCEIKVLDAPTLFESGADKLCDRIIAVLCDENKRKDRIVARDNLSCEQADARLSRAKSNEFFIERANAVVYNDGTLDELEINIKAALNQIGVV
ncbi:MAG: dephospho-CoA kinase [Oscillospiraceae bacterium]|nr:dephospho-CoA kinase [Oscillospiraceae bacterium]